MRCSGTLPCEYCIREEAAESCDYGPGTGPPPQCVQDDSEGDEVSTPTRPPFDPPLMFANDQHVGQISGISFLYHPWNKGNTGPAASPDHDPDVQSGLEQHQWSTTPLESYGDLPQAPVGTGSSITDELKAREVPIILERYFRFATPTYRFMHRPTLEKWASRYVAGDSGLRNAQKACVLLACAQSLLYTVKSDKYVTDEHDTIRQSKLWFQKGKELLDQEMGPPSLASVQSRLAMCLYMLSTFRMNACRFCFGLTATLITTLGLHRKQSTDSPPEIGSVEAESRKRAFWCAYVLDGYLSVMLGRPRLFRDEDVDQPYPRNIDDQDLMSTEGVENLPHHGNLEAFFGHMLLAKLMAKNSDRLYPLHALTEDQVLLGSKELLDELDAWKQALPVFLTPGPRTLTGERTFERQNTVLKLAHAHLRMLMTRRCLLVDTTRHGAGTGESLQQQPQNSRFIRPILECVAGITTVLDVVSALVDRGALYHCYWFTQYIALVAISTLYVFLIQGSRNALPGTMRSYIDVEAYFDKAKQCQSQLDALAPPGSQAKRHHHLLDHLRRRVERDLQTIRRPLPEAPVVTSAGDRPSPSSAETQSLRAVQPQNDSNQAQLGAMAVPFSMRQQQQSPNGNLPQNVGVGVGVGMSSPSTITHTRLGFDDFESFAPPLNYATPDADQSIANILDLGWETLDAIGFMMPAEGDNFGM